MKALPAITFPKIHPFLKSIIIWSNFILKTLHAISGRSSALIFLSLTNLSISGHWGLQVIVTNKSGYPYLLQTAIASWQLLNMYLIPPVKVEGRIMHIPNVAGSVSPQIITSSKPLKISDLITFWFNLTHWILCALIIV